MTPCKELGYKVGDRFKLCANAVYASALKKDILVLTLDDNTNAPLFRNETTGQMLLCWLTDVVRFNNIKRNVE